MQPTNPASGNRAHALWAFPFIGGLLPATGALIALWLSNRLDLIPACNPFFEGCVSISLAGRHDLPNYIFRAFLLSGAVLQAVTWLLCTAWLRGIGADPRRALRVLPWLGLLAGAFLVLYGTFLGTEGRAYQWLRRYGIVVYFSFTYLSMLIAAGHLQRIVESGRARVPAHIERILLGICVVTLALGLVSVFLPVFYGDEGFKYRLENVMEWNAALLFTVYFTLLALVWRRTGFVARLSTDAVGVGRDPS
ncbi:MAG: hypothetical protein WDZ63_17075 [Burkholderiales bacterium]